MPGFVHTFNRLHVTTSEVIFNTDLLHVLPHTTPLPSWLHPPTAVLAQRLLCACLNLPSSAWASPELQDKLRGEVTSLLCHMEAANTRVLQIAKVVSKHYSHNSLHVFILPTFFLVTLPCTG